MARQSNRKRAREVRHSKKEERQAKRVMIGIGIAALVLIVLSFVAYSLY